MPMTVLGSYSITGGSTFNQSHTEGLIPDSYIDSIGHPKPYVTGGNFSLQKTDRRYPRVSGKFFRISNYTLNGWHGGPAATLPSSISITDFDTINDVLARSNPSKPAVDVPVFLVELREVPRMFLELSELPSFFKARGRVLLDKLSKGNLSYQFGWRPFVSDLMSLVDFRQGIEDRTSELQSLYEKGGLKFKTRVYEASDRTDWTFSTTVTPSPSGIDCYVRTLRTIRKWYSVSWVPIDPMTGLSWSQRNNKIRDQAFRSYYGLEVNLSAAWEALPWSWLADWFSDIGSILNASRNSAGFKPGDCYTMTNQVLRREYRYQRNPSSPAVWTGQPIFQDGFVSRETKTRVKGSSALPSVKLPILTDKQLSILGSIAWLTARR
jgi:hypothetical protein